MIKRKRTDPYPDDLGERFPHTLRDVHKNGVCLPQGSQFRRSLRETYFPGDIIQLTAARAQQLHSIVERIYEAAPQPEIPIQPAKARTTVPDVETRAVDTKGGYDVSRSHPRVYTVSPKR